MLTEEEVKERATSPEAALDVSIQHWQENVAMTEEDAKSLSQFNCFNSSGSSPVAGGLCGLCRYKEKNKREGCNPCILNEKATRCEADGSLWKKATQAWNAYKNERGSFADWVKSAVDMVELLKRLMAENYCKDKCEKKVELRHGDYGIDKRDGTMLVVEHGRGNDRFPMTAYEYGGMPCGYIINNKVATRDVIWLGNIFDDLKRNSEDLREFEKRNLWGGNSFEMKVEEGKIQFWIEGRLATGKLGESKEIYQALGQMIATAERDKK